MSVYRNDRFGKIYARSALTWCLVTVLLQVCDAAPVADDSISWLENGQIRLGVNLDLGGSITYLADAKTGDNLINSYDWGRQIQLSFYSGPNPFIPEGKQVHDRWKGLGWNPIQSGDVYGNRSQVIAHINDGNSILIRCIPMIWPLNNVPAECVFEVRFTLKGRTVQVFNRLVNNRSDKTFYKARSQELPAIYTNGPYHRLMTYTGNQPFTGGALVEIPKQEHPPEGIRWAHWYGTENWAAMVNDQDFGLGIWHPGAYNFIGGFAGGQPGFGGAKDEPTGYIAPLHKEILDWNIDYVFSYVLIVDTLTNIRHHIYANAARDTLPYYEFAKDRQHWTYQNASDAGWPIQGYLEIHADGPNPQCISPEAFWQAQSDHKLKITLSARKNTAPKNFSGRLYWKTVAQNKFTEKEHLAIEITGDEKFRTYSLEIGKHAGYTGIVTGLRFDPFDSAESGEWVRIKSLVVEQDFEVK